MELWGIFLRTVFVYFFIFLMMRLMGKREIGKLSIFDLIVSFMIADISAISLESLDQPLIQGLIPILTIVVLQILLSYVSLKSEKLRHWIDGEPIIIIRNGKIQQKTMAKARYNIDDLIMQLREKDISDIQDVEFAILETSGKLSVFPRDQKQQVAKEDVSPETSETPFQMPIPVIIEGKVQDHELTKIGQNRFWLKQEIQKQNYKDFKEVFYASINQHGELYIDMDERQSKK